MSNKEAVNINFGPSMTLVTIVLIVLKLTHVIDISWWWVFSPIWLPLGLAIGLMLLMLLIIIFAQIIVGLLDR